MTLNISKVCLEYGVSGLREHEMRGNPWYHRSSKVKKSDASLPNPLPEKTEGKSGKHL